MLQCQDDSLYTGITTNVERRFAEHQKGVGSNFTRAKKALKIVYTEEYPDRSAALKREAAIKRLSRVEKLALAGS